MFIKRKELNFDQTLSIKDYAKGIEVSFSLSVEEILFMKVM